jgi:hypothetical protein
VSKTAPSRVVAILGMHRSGTSWLAGSLEEMGVALGEVSTADPHNQKGNRESPELMALHDRVLRRNDGSWKRPPKQRGWSPEESAELVAYVERMDAAYPLWGFKDPRALLLIHEWMLRVPHMERVGIYRHPLAVHRSLNARNPRFHRARSVKLWAAYNAALVAEHQRSPFPVLRFDVAPADVNAQLRAVAAGLSLPASEASFFDDSLVHQNEDEPKIPWRCRKQWAYLEGVRLRP